MEMVGRAAHYDDVNLRAVSGNFYRYRRFDDPKNKKRHRNEERERIERMLVDRIVWFAKPSTLNDPFDCKPVLAWSKDMKVNRKHIEQAWKKGHERHHGIKPKNRNIVARHVSTVMASLNTQHKRNELFAEAIDKRGVLCLSEDWRITQQWTYYAREHTGFCVECKIRDDQLSAFRVEYRTERPEIDLIRLFVDDTYGKKIDHPSLLVKADAWKHEAEVRILRNGHGNHPLPDDIFQSITFGMAAKKKDIHWIRMICDKAGLKMPFYQYVMDDKKWVLRRRELTNDSK